MTRKTFIKKMMSFGLSRNALNNLTREFIVTRDKMRIEGKKVLVTWSYVFEDFMRADVSNEKIMKFNEKWGKK